ncbi:MAG: hypothetical protein L6V93_17915 [Clostridiales bacterium]|nr:MAG: hypothetical protein L6V93_17915 [Clostridiales bacterium]
MKVKNANPAVHNGGFASRKSERENGVSYAFAPDYRIFFVFSLYPILWAAQKAFYYYNTIPNDTRFVGLENFLKRVITSDPTYWNTWLTTLKFALYKNAG